MNIHKRIDELCQSRNWTYYELSVQAGLSANTVYTWKTKNAMPTIPMLEKIADAFEMTLEQFFCGFIGDLTTDERLLLENWHYMSDDEKDAITNLMHTFKILKRSKAT